jgi:hypothetical protein
MTGRKIYRSPPPAQQAVGRRSGPDGAFDAMQGRLHAAKIVPVDAG